MSANTVQNFSEVAEQFPGIKTMEPKALGEFALYCVNNFPKELYDGMLGSEDWHREVFDVMRSATNWLNDHEESSAADFSESICENYLIKRETDGLLKLLASADSHTGFSVTATYLRRWGFELEHEYDKSPMFPEGRIVRSSLEPHIDREQEEFDLPWSAGVVRDDAAGIKKELSAAIMEYISSKHAALSRKEDLRSITSEISPIDGEALEKLRETYGAKAANLLTVQQALAIFYEEVKDKEYEDYIQRINIPNFYPVSVDVFDQWRSGDGNWEASLEVIRQQALYLSQNTEGGLVAIRSSAVYSEDGDDHTGAGIYRSVTVDPNDSKAFAGAVQEVYESVDNPNAVAYREQCNIPEEKMGLVIQGYEEIYKRNHGSGLVFGYVNSIGADARLIEAHTPEGVLLFDKDQVRQNHMLLDNHEDFLHSQPDHSKKLSFMVNEALSAAHAALFAETIFSKPVQIEYVENSVVQARPLPKLATAASEQTVTFPDTGVLSRSKAIGVGDATLELLDEHQNNSAKTGFVVFMTEHGFTDNFIRGHNGVDALPKEGAVVILGSSNSGHIQTLCQERGLMCFYLKKDENVFDDLTLLLDDNIDSDKPLALRFISDGYEGRVYEA